MRNINRLLFFTLALALSLRAAAQTMKVTSFSLLEHDLTANTRGTIETDKDGETAALIKIVTQENGFIFEGGSLGIVKSMQKTGEWWLYVPPFAMKLTIKHPKFGVLRDYVYPTLIEGGRTYEMLLDIGTGRYVTIDSSRKGADVEIDGQYIGQTPIHRYYLLFGTHTIKASSSKWEGKMEYTVADTGTTSSQQLVLNVQMQDMSSHYGQGRLTVDNNADIFFAQRKVGKPGEWDFDLYEGTYEVETRKADCDPERTTFTVKPGAEGNDVTVKAPTPHTGWLSIYTRPRNVMATDNGKPINLSEVQTLPVGTHQIGISRKGYQPQQYEYKILWNETTRDTIQLERVTYVRPRAFYFGAGYSVGSLAGFSGLIGVVLYRHDLQLSYTFGTQASDKVFWYDDSHNYQTAMSYKQNVIAVKYGYQIPLLSRMAITPQVGYNQQTYSGKIEDGSVKYADGATASSISIGLKVAYVPFQHCYLFVSPEYRIAIQKDEAYNSMAESAGINASQFALHAGVLVNF